MTREKLSKEQYLAMKEEGLSDRAILCNVIGKYLPDVITALKTEWGLLGVDPKKDPPDNCITIAAAIELHDELDEELDCLNWLLNPEAKTPLVTSIRLLLDERRCQTATRLQRIRTAFTSQTVAI